MSYAILDGIELCKITRFEIPDGLIADEHYTASGAHRRDVLAMTRTWEITLDNLNADEWATLFFHFQQHTGRSLFWSWHLGGTYDSHAVPVTVRMRAANHGKGEQGAPPAHWVTEDGDHIVTEDGDHILFDTLRPRRGPDYRGGSITLTIKETIASAPGGGWGTPGSEVLAIPGPEGPAGLSAYQVALDNGFVGSPNEWLASLEGPEGPQGEPGTIITAGSDEPSEARPGDLHIDTDTGDVLEWDE